MTPSLLRPAVVENGCVPERRTILVVDDDALVREALQECLEVYGFNVLTAADGVQACGIFLKESARIDLVVSDVLMPKMNGFYAYQVMSRIKPGLKAILVSGYPSGVEMIGDGSTNVPEFMSKPISSREFLAKIKDMLGDA